MKNILILILVLIGFSANSQTYTAAQVDAIIKSTLEEVDRRINNASKLIYAKSPIYFDKDTIKLNGIIGVMPLPAPDTSYKFLIFNAKYFAEVIQPIPGSLITLNPNTSVESNDAFVGNGEFTFKYRILDTTKSNMAVLYDVDKGTSLGINYISRNGTPTIEVVVNGGWVPIVLTGGYVNKKYYYGFRKTTDKIELIFSGDGISWGVIADLKKYALSPFTGAVKFNGYISSVGDGFTEVKFTYKK